MEWTTPAMPRIDWDARTAQPIDPYLIWADITGFESFNDGPELLDGKALAAMTLRVAFEAAPGSLSPERRYAELVCSAESAYATASISLQNLSDLLDDPNVKRLELSHAGRDPVWPSEASDFERVDRPVVAVIDFGCAFAHESFRFHDGQRWCSRIAYLWDQTDEDDVPHPWRKVPDQGYGRELDRRGIDFLLAKHERAGRIDEDAIYRTAHYGSVAKALTHGTHVLDLAAGARLDQTPDELPDIIFVELPRYAVDDTSGGSMVAHVMDALRYIRSRTADGFPVVVNLSYGSMAGPHDGSTLLEMAMDAWIEASIGPPNAGGPARHAAIVLAAGNNFETDTHAYLPLSRVHPSRDLLWQVMADDDSDTFLEIWYPKASAGTIEVTVTPPNGRPQVVGIDDTWALGPSVGVLPACAVIHRRHVASGLNDAMVLVALAPTRSRKRDRPLAPSGIWQIRVACTEALDDDTEIAVHAWIERDDQPVGSGGPPRQSKFVSVDPRLPVNADSPAGAIIQRATTCSSIANGLRTVVVGACLAPENFEFSRYTSAGPTRNARRFRGDGVPPWPDLVAPADESRSIPGIIAAGSRSGLKVRMNGTSVAAPQATRELIGNFLPYPRGSGTPLPNGTLLVDPAKPIQSELPVNVHRLGAGRLAPLG